MRAINRRSATALLLSAIAALAFAGAKAAEVKVPSRGFNLPDWLAAEPRFPADAVLDRLKSLGFETIRLPVDPDLVPTTGFADRVAGVLDEITAKGFNAILDLHPAGSLDFESDFNASAARVEAAWNILADVVAATSVDQVYPELLNEPPMSAKAWGPLRDRLAEIVRAKCPDHTLVWGPARVQGIWELDDTKPLADPNSIAAVHYYTPMGFTHQGENWDDSPLARLKDLPFPATRKSPEVVALAASLKASGDQAALGYLEGEFQGPWTDKHIADDFATLARWSRKHRTPVMLNEFGVLNFAVDATSRTNWVRAVRQAAEANGICWTYWEADQGFGFIADRSSTEGFDQPMIEALLA